MQLATDHGTKPNLLKVEFVPYEFPSGAHPGYKALCAERKAEGIKVMCMSVGRRNGFSYGPARIMSIETKHVFGNQWNSAPDKYSSSGLRVFNWYEEYTITERDKRGHYLKVTEEMRELCRLTHKCGYCGAEYYGADNQGKFCSGCLDSEYLKEVDLHLLRLMPVEFDGAIHTKRLRLTTEELAWLTPFYVARQTTGEDSSAATRMKQKRQQVIDKYKKAMEAAQTEHDGFIWLLDRNINTDNVIYYSHTDTFCFGWRSPLDKEVRSKILDLISEFPFAYELK